MRLEGLRGLRSQPTAVLLGLVFALGCGSQRSTSGPTQVSPPSGSARKAAPAPKSALESAQEMLAKSDYAAALTGFLKARSLAKSPAQSVAAELGRLEVLLVTGRNQEVVALAREVNKAFGHVERSLVLEAKALRAQGEVAQAEAVLAASQQKLTSPEARLLLGEILLEQGKAAEADAAFMGLIEAYNEDTITEQDGVGLAMVGRAAHLLSSAKDANDAFNQSERVLDSFEQRSLWRAELFLEKYDPGHAEEVLAEVLKRAPNQPEANTWLARVRLDQAYDFDEAERLARKALAVNPRLTAAYAVLAGVALRESHLEDAESRLRQGLEHNPRDLELLSLQATARYLLDDTPGFEAAKARVLALNPGYSRLFNIIGDFAEWEHRYDEIVVMMREALQMDPENAKARAQLGLNLIRAGKDLPGLTALRHAFNLDPFNVRVYNTLDLFEREIPKSYITLEALPFRFRYPKSEQAILERYVPELLGRAYQKMVKSYGFTPEGPVGVELYSSRQSFAVRTSGLPETVIQGVCFGRTLAAMSLGEEKFNLGMTLWHELAHVFHIQQSRSRVPRWFTEGLAEYETLSERPEWAREQDPDLVEALRLKKLPELAAMTSAFTRVEDIADVATAYYASTEAIEFLAEKYGRGVFPKMLRAWGAGKRTPEVLQETLGASPEALNQGFVAFLQQRLLRYRNQFLPVRRTGSPEHAFALASQHPEDPKNLARWVLLLQRQKREAEAGAALASALKRFPKDAELRFLKARALAEGENSTALLEVVGALIREGYDGYDVQMLLGDAFRLQQDWDRALLALQRAHEWDPNEVEPLRAIAQLGRRLARADVELDALRKLVLLDEHNPDVYQRLLQRLLELGKTEEGIAVGEAAVYADMSGFETHRALGELFVLARKPKEAIFELESATLCAAKPAELAAVHRRLAELFKKEGNPGAAQAHLEKAVKVEAQPATPAPVPSPTP